MKLRMVTSSRPRRQYALPVFGLAPLIRPLWKAYIVSLGVYNFFETFSLNLTRPTTTGSENPLQSPYLKRLSTL